ncbi:hypothetical protein MJO28_003745 [Puccinia striiformis f. sp. tritici]|uniref:Uncharacterized protein n=1 Tax=Puccinia striiformis f. sp. tritici TaxID=168172 RepID=A0ACC0ENH1_9BASI|nr:hypothetical protein MJO28_003745 [Puccinia striiformis f. sp. tritici]
MTNNPHINPIFFQSPPNEVVTSSIPAPSADNSSIPALSSVDNIPTMDFCHIKLNRNSMMMLK